MVLLQPSAPAALRQGDVGQGDGLVINLGNQQAILIDAGPDEVVIDNCLNTLGIKKIALLVLTHFHADHVGGILKLLDKLGGDIPVYGPRGDNIPGRTHLVKDGDVIEILAPRLTLKVLEVPGHTLSHIAYFANMQANVVEPMLFCGDTLFASGCGRLFEGTPTQMSQSLDKFKRLPKNTLVYCTHEYTLSNIRFALAVEPNNVNLISWSERAKELRDKNLPTLPTTIGQELQVNPFMRCDQVDVIESAKHQSKQSSLPSDAHVLAVVRAWKDQF